MEVQTILERVGENLNVRRAFGPPYEHDGALVVPVALVVGGGGGGHQPQQEAEGAGFGGVVHPLGAYVIGYGGVRFVPTYEATVLGMGLLALLRLVIRRRSAPPS